MLGHAAAPTPLATPATIAELVRVAIAESTRQLLARDAAIRLAGEVEDIHRPGQPPGLRSDLKTLDRYCDEFRIEALRRELVWLGGMLGHVRDADVLAGHLDARSAGGCFG